MSLTAQAGAPTSTVEDYLKCILREEHREPEAPVATGRISGQLRVSPGTVTSMLQTLERKGLVSYRPYAGVRLTRDGRRLALDVLRRHRLLELFLVEVVGLSWSEVHPEAERLEHAVSDRLIDRIDEMLGRPEIDPHGDPIPSPGGRVAAPTLGTLLTCELSQSVRVARIRDQREEFLRWVESHGLLPGSRLRVVERDGTAETLRLELADGREVGLGFGAAASIEVRAS